MEKRRPKLKRLPINHLIPNILTISALCAGMTAINFAARDMWEASVFAIVVAAILDGLDGRVARLLNAQRNLVRNWIPCLILSVLVWHLP